MTTYDPAAIRARLKTLFETLKSGESAVISYVYDFNNPNIEGYPAIVFDITDEESTMLDEANNQRTITFTAYLIAEVKVKGLDGATTVLDNATKQVIDLLEDVSNADLSGTVDWVTPVMGRRTQVSSPEGNVIYQEMKIKCNLAASIL